MTNRLGDFKELSSLGYVINLAARQMAQALQRRLSEHGVQIGQFPLLLALWRQEGLTQAELVRHVRMEQATVANTLNRMQRDGLITRRPDPADARRSHIFLTDRAKRLAEPLLTHAKAVNAEAQAGLNESERERLLALLKTVSTTLKG